MLIGFKVLNTFCRVILFLFTKLLDADMNLMDTLYHPECF